ncbi:MAG: YukJ family protein [Proteobacteria bacterium]|nr:YukJ family protein [Pseudomonadota bacterium]
MSYYRNTRPQLNRGQFISGNSPLTYGAIIGTLEVSTERPIQGRNGDHLQFYLKTQDNRYYQADVNTRSRDGSDIGVYIAEEPLPPATDATPTNPFGPEHLGFDGHALLSYRKIGLTDQDFVALDYTRIEGQLEADLGAARFVMAYGMAFDDGGPNGKGIHEVHFNPSAPGAPDQDGALALYTLDAQTMAPKRVWYFFKFRDDNIP